MLQSNAANSLAGSIQSDPLAMRLEAGEITEPSASLLISQVKEKYAQVRTKLGDQAAELQAVNSKVDALTQQLRTVPRSPARGGEAESNLAEYNVDDLLARINGIKSPQVRGSQPGSRVSSAPATPDNKK
jgi:small-conductance mechanosensitive channel